MEYGGIRKYGGRVHYSQPSTLEFIDANRCLARRNPRAGGNKPTTPRSTPDSTSSQDGSSSSTTQFHTPEPEPGPEQTEQNRTETFRNTPENQEENATATKPKYNLNPLRGLMDWWQPQP